MHLSICATTVLCSAFLLAGNAHAQNNTAPPVVLTDSGKALEAKYTATLTGLQSELEKAIPKLDETKIAAWMQAIQAEEGPEKEALTKAKEVEKMQGSEGRLRGLEVKLENTTRMLEYAQENLADARARGDGDPEKANALKTAESYLATWQRNTNKIQAEIEKAKKEVEEAKVKLPEAIKAAETVRQAHNNTLVNTWKAMDALGVSGLLSSDSLDAKLARYLILKEATPTGLASFAQQSAENNQLVEQLFADKDLMLQMLVNDGAEKGKYGQAMKIYTDILKASTKAKDGVYQRLALATSLAHAEPILKRDKPTGDVVKVTAEMKNDPSLIIDPVQRYLSLEKWYDAGELQKGFDRLNVWSLRRVVDCSDPDEMMVWGRQMLHTLRPDCIPDDDDTLKYVNVTFHEIAFHSKGLVNDLPDKHFMQNILANGGICGRRAFFTRFILQSFGVPAIERVEPGHSAVALWHPSGWKTKLGGNFGKSDRGFYAKMSIGGGGYGADVNFVASSQAREDETGYLKVKRAQWIASLMGEKWKPGLITWSGKTTGPTPPKPGEIVKPTTWSDISLHEQRRIISQLRSSETKPSASPAVAKEELRATGKASVNTNGVITIPSAACSSPTESNRVLHNGRQADHLGVFLRNKQGKTLLHVSRYPKTGSAFECTFEYTFDAPKAGKYQLVADLATSMPNRKLSATANDGSPVEMALPYTIGLWGKTDPVEVELKAGSNVLRFCGLAGAIFDQFTLTPVM